MKAKDTSVVLDKLRQLMLSSAKSCHPLQAIIVPSSDAHQSEYLADSDLRRVYVSGFSGSAGTAVITQTQAALWTDGRYFLQAEKELDVNWSLMKQGLKDTPSIVQWLNSVLPSASYVGVNPFLYSSGSWNDMLKSLEKNGHSLIPTTNDLIDEIWSERPQEPTSSLMIVSEAVSGRSISSKIEEIRRHMEKRNAQWLVVTALDDVAWLFNMRGADIEFNPVFFAYAVIGDNSAHLFIKSERLTDEIRAHLGSSIRFHEYDQVVPFLKQKCAGQRTWMSENSSHAVVSAVPEEARIVTTNNLVNMMKCVKNCREIEGMRDANVNDAVALCRFYHWMESKVPSGGVTECSAAAESLRFRQQEDNFVSLSFATISSSGPTGSIIHYSPNPLDDKPVKSDQLYLCDSGAQYRNGTTDTTRTMHFGQPTAYEKECFTRVLKGHIALARAVFPTGTKGYWLDTLARMHLWSAGLDYRHGTGHGVGSFLNVHEGPVGCYIGNSDRVVPLAADVELKPGMVITDEPGYYEDGKFGIRIENALLCKVANTKYNFGEKQFFEFEVIALVPIQQKMIDVSLMTPDEVAWLNQYHEQCRAKVGTQLRSRGHTLAYEWLLKETVPLLLPS